MFVAEWERRFCRALGANIRRTRQAQGLSQVAFAERLGTSPAVLCHWERGARRMGIAAAARIAAALGVGLEALIDGEPRLLLKRALAGIAPGGAEA